MKNAKRARNKKNPKASQKISKGAAGRKAKQPIRRVESLTKKKRIKNETGKNKGIKRGKTGVSRKTIKSKIRVGVSKSKLSRALSSIPKNKQRSSKNKRGNKSAPLRPTKHEKTSTEIFNEIRAKGGTFKDLARRF